LPKYPETQKLSLKAGKNCCSHLKNSGSVCVFSHYLYLAMCCISKKVRMPESQSWGHKFHWAILVTRSHYSVIYPATGWLTYGCNMGTCILLTQTLQPALVATVPAGLMGWWLLLASVQLQVWKGFLAWLG